MVPLSYLLLLIHLLSHPHDVGGGFLNGLSGGEDSDETSRIRREFVPATTSEWTISSSTDTMCPIDRLYPPYKHQILPYDPPSTTNGVEDDLSEISGLIFSNQTDSQGSLYAYAASDKNQFSLKVIQFSRSSQTGTPILKSGVTVATYALDTNYSTSDWEDLSLGPCSGALSAPTCIYVGDFGNNNRGAPYVQRTVLRVLKFQEPQFSGSTPTSLVKVPVTTILYKHGPGWNSTLRYDAETMFVDWVGSGKGDIYIVTKATCSMGGVGRIPASYHGRLRVGNIPSSSYIPSKASVYSMARAMTAPPKQGSMITCSNGGFRVWQGGDMRRDGQLIALLAGGSPPRVYFYPRLPEETVMSALRSPQGESASCPFIAPISYGLSNEKKHEAVAFLPDGLSYADTSECDGGRRCDVPIYFWDLVYPNSPDPTLRSGPVPVDGWQTLAFETFESGTMGSFSSGSKAYPSSALACPNGQEASLWSAHLSEHGGEASSIVHNSDYDASNYSWLKVEFDFVLDGFDHMDAFFLELSLDSGRNFFIVADWAMDTTQGMTSLRTCHNGNTVVLNSNIFGRMTFGPHVRLRFRTSADSIDDRLYVDNIRLLGNPTLLSN